MDEWPVMNSGMLKTMASLNSMYNQIGSNSVSGFDPYQVMLKRKNANDQTEDGYINTPVEQYDPNDIRELETFCANHGIIGFNFGRMNPKTALRMLKSKMGVVETQSHNKIMLCD